MALPTRNKIVRSPANCNCLADSESLTRAKYDLAVAVARPSLIKGGLVHISDPVRRILARLASRMR